MQWSALNHYRAFYMKKTHDCGVSIGVPCLTPRTPACARAVDYVFGPKVGQAELYAVLGAPLVDVVVGGHNATVSQGPNRVKHCGVYRNGPAYK